MPKECHGCKLPIHGPYMRAKSLKFHIDCFKCTECDDSIADSYFALEVAPGNFQFYCEFDYFSKLDLICTVCNEALREPHITTLHSGKFHQDHFRCQVCNEKIRSIDSYFEENGKIFCEYHHTVATSSHCLGCKTSIYKTYVDDKLVKDGKWHPSCFMLNNLWGAQYERINYDKENLDEQVQLQSQTIRLVERILIVLGDFESSNLKLIDSIVAKSYKDCIEDQKQLIQNIGSLLENVMIVDEELDNSLVGRISLKEPKRLVKSLLMFLAAVSKTDGVVESERLDYQAKLSKSLKRVIKAGLLGSILLEQNDEFDTTISQYLNRLDDADNEISPKLLESGATDVVCHLCNSKISESSYLFRSYKWHRECSKCQTCKVSLEKTPHTTLIDPDTGYVYCPDHGKPNMIEGVQKSSHINCLFPILRDALQSHKK
ncbi:hypothetical protein BC833DRAFT_587093 [Globomyces pollinis-pini]|nr:hypothetical protein BC833DRAFT_587093 [Globomyces pollinis-pini]